MTTLAPGSATTLLVIAKQPVPGRVKTRRVPPCTPELAAALAEAALTDTLLTVLRARELAAILGQAERGRGEADRVLGETA